MRYFGLLMFPAKTLHASYRYRAELPTTPQLGCIHTYLYDLPTVICIYTYFVVVLNFGWPFQTQRQPRLEHTYIEVRKARYIYVVQAERDEQHKGDEQFCEQFRYKPRANTARGSSSTGQVDASAGYRRVERTALVDI